MNIVFLCRCLACLEDGYWRDIRQGANAVPSCWNVISLVERAKDCHSVFGN